MLIAGFSVRPDLAEKDSGLGETLFSGTGGVATAFLGAFSMVFIVGTIGAVTELDRGRGPEAA